MKQRNIFSGLLGGLGLVVTACLLVAQEGPPLSLAEAVALALLHNPRILHARQEIALAHARSLQAGAIPGPQLSLSGTRFPRGSILPKPTSGRSA